jgi:hypothetical protein
MVNGSVAGKFAVRQFESPNHRLGDSLRITIACDRASRIVDGRGIDLYAPLH